MEDPQLETLKEEVELLQQKVDELTVLNKQKSELREEQAARKQAHFFLLNFFIPFFEGVCENRTMTPEEGIITLIQDNETLDQILLSNREQAAQLVDLPEFRVVISAIRSIADKDDKWIKEKSQVLLEVLEEVNGTLANSINKTKGGKKWFSDSLIGLKHVLFKSP